MDIKILADRIRTVLKKRGINRAEAAREIGISHVAVGRILLNQHKWVKPENEQKICAWLRCHGEKINVSTATPIPPNFRPVKIYGLAQACALANPPCDVAPASDYDLDEILYWKANGHRIAAFRVEGDSMSPDLKNGWVVICDCDAEIQNGDIAWC